MSFIYNIGVEFIDMPLVILLAMILGPVWYFWIATRSMAIIYMWLPQVTAYMFVSTQYATLIGWMIMLLVVSWVVWTFILRLMSSRSSGPGQTVGG